MPRPPRPQRSRALLVGTCALAAVVGGCGRQKKIESPIGLYKYGVPRAPDMTPVPVVWSQGPTQASPPAGEAPAPAPPPPPPPPPPAAKAEAPPPAAARPAAEAHGSYRVVPVDAGGTIRGFVRLRGDSARPPLDIFKDNDKGCGARVQPTERLIVGAGGAVANCVVSVRGIKAGKDFPPQMRVEDRTFLLDQKGCRYRPHVDVLRAQTQVVVKNSDGADHNIHGYLGSVAVTKFNFSSSPGSTNGDSEGAFLSDPGLYLVKCDIHPWMSAVLHVVTHPYNEVTSAEDAGGKKAGEFVIDGIPPGEYEVVCWHEGMEEHPQMQDGKIATYSYSSDVFGTPDVQGKVGIAAGETKTVNFTIDAPAKK